MAAPLLCLEETVLHAQKKTPNRLWHGGDRSLKHDVLIMLPQQFQNVTAPQHVADKGDARGPGTLGQPIWKAVKGFGGHGRVSGEPFSHLQWSGTTTRSVFSTHFELLLIRNWKQNSHNIKALRLLTSDHMHTHMLPQWDQNVDNNVLLNYLCTIIISWSNLMHANTVLQHIRIIISVSSQKPCLYLMLMF